MRRDSVDDRTMPPQIISIEIDMLCESDRGLRWIIDTGDCISPATLILRLQNYSVHKNNPVVIFLPPYSIVPRVSVVLQIWESCDGPSAISCSSSMVGSKSFGHQNMFQSLHLQDLTW